MKKESLTILDLFAGAGGLSEGFWQNGYEIVGHIEMDKEACETLKTRAVYHALKEKDLLSEYYLFINGKVTRNELVKKYNLQAELDSVIHSEISKKTYQGLLKKIKKNLDGKKLIGIIGGPPCQAYSSIGRARDKNSMVNDSRNHLYKFYLKFLKDLNPEFFIFENVPGIFTAGGGKYLKDMLKGMKKLGYSVPDPRTLNTADYNVPQSRKRVIVVGWKKNKKINIEDLFSKPQKIEFKVKDFLKDLPVLKSGTGESISSYITEAGVLKKIGVRTKNDKVLSHVARPHNERDLNIYKFAVNKYIKGEKMNYNELPSTLKTHKNTTSFLDRFKVIKWEDRASHTIVAHISKDGHYYIHPDIKQNRSLTVREVARLQTFPDSYKFEGSRTAQFRQIGNAVPPIFSKILAERLKKYLINNHGKDI